MFLSKLKIVTAITLTLGLLTAGGTGVTHLHESRAAQTQDKEPSSADQQEQIELLIKQLGSAKFREREAATRDLAKIGKTALPALEKAARSADLETSRRAQTIINTIIPPKNSFSTLSVNGDMVVPLKGTYSQILIGDVNGNGKIEGMDIDAEEIWIGSVNGNAKVKLKGKTKKLRFGPINGDCQIDCSELAADAAEITEINGSPQLKLQSLGPVRFAAEVTGSAAVAANAKGEIRFSRVVHAGSSFVLTTKGNVLLDDGISGDARLKVVLAKDFTVQGRVGDNVTIEANYYGKATCVGSPKARIVLKKVDAPE